jgi:hypothetical protein
LCAAALRGAVPLNRPVLAAETLMLLIGESF